MDYLTKAFEYIRNTDNADFEGKKSLSLIETAEEYLGVTFPLEYRSFLLEFGCGDVDGVEIFGIINDKFDTNIIPDAIAITAKERKANLIEDDVILIADSLEYFYGLDLSKVSEGKVPVLELIPGKKKEDCLVVSDSFGEFLCMKLGL